MTFGFTQDMNSSLLGQSPFPPFLFKLKTLITIILWSLKKSNLAHLCPDTFKKVTMM